MCACFVGGLTWQLHVWDHNSDTASYKLLLSTRLLYSMVSNLARSKQVPSIFRQGPGTLEVACVLQQGAFEARTCTRI